METIILVTISTMQLFDRRSKYRGISLEVRRTEGKRESSSPVHRLSTELNIAVVVECFPDKWTKKGTLEHPSFAPVPPSFRFCQRLSPPVRSVANPPSHDGVVHCVIRADDSRALIQQPGLRRAGSTGSWRKIGVDDRFRHSEGDGD